MANLIRNLVTLFPSTDAIPGMFEAVRQTILLDGVRALAGGDEIEVIFHDFRVRSRAADGTMRQYLIDSEPNPMPDFACNGIFGPVDRCDRLPEFVGVPRTGPALSFMAESKWRPMFTWTQAVMSRHFDEGLRFYSLSYDVGDVPYYKVIPTVECYTVETSVADTLQRVRTEGIPEEVDKFGLEGVEWVTAE